MCTVTFVRRAGETIITSNRDEQVARPAALLPQAYLINRKKVTFPKDPLGGGTWFAVDDFGNAVVLLNGARNSHRSLPVYRKSRGLIVLEIISSESLIGKWNQIDLSNIEAFTLILLEGGSLYDLRWDGVSKETNLVEANNGIWSSSTLYGEDVKLSREKWFEELIAEKGNAISGDDLLNFHSTSHHDDEQNGLVIDRLGLLKTLSITQATISGGITKMTYLDLEALNFKQAAVSL